jgi:hypothetical protein
MSRKRMFEGGVPTPHQPLSPETRAKISAVAKERGAAKKGPRVPEATVRVSFDLKVTLDPPDDARRDAILAEMTAAVDHLIKAWDLTGSFVRIR